MRNKDKTILETLKNILITKDDNEEFRINIVVNGNKSATIECYELGGNDCSPDTTADIETKGADATETELTEYLKKLCEDILHMLK